MKKVEMLSAGIFKGINSLFQVQSMSQHNSKISTQLVGNFSQMLTVWFSSHLECASEPCLPMALIIIPESQLSVTLY